MTSKVIIFESSLYSSIVLPMVYPPGPTPSGSLFVGSGSLFVGLEGFDGTKSTSSFSGTG